MIIATIGPASDSLDLIKSLIDNGMDIARINGAHGTDKTNLDKIKKIRSIKKDLPVLLDIPGPKIRLGDLEKPIKIEKNQEVTLSVSKKTKYIYIPHPFLIKELKPGYTLLIDDANLKLEVIKIHDKKIICRALNSHIIKSRKGVNIPELNLDYTKLTEKDTYLIEFAVKNRLDYIGVSFIGNVNIIGNIRNLIRNSNVKIISKIETQKGLDNFNDILQVSDSIMIDRGDLGSEVGVENVPKLQKKIIQKCNKYGKPAIVATQMLESMVNNPTPTKAEINDIANSILDGANAVMLSGETASGRYPVESIKTMKHISDKFTKEKNRNSWSSAGGKKIPSLYELDFICSEEKQCLVEKPYKFFSLRITRLFLRLKHITQFRIALISFLLGLTSALFFASGHHIFILIGVVLLQLSFILGIVNKEFIKYRNIKDDFGNWFTAIYQNITCSLTYAFASLGLFIYTKNPLTLILGLFAVANILIISNITSTRVIGLSRSNDLEGYNEFKIGKNLFIGGTSTAILVITIGALLDKIFFALLFYALFGFLLWSKQLLSHYRLKRAV